MHPHLGEDLHLRLLRYNAQSTHTKTFGSCAVSQDFQANGMKQKAQLTVQKTNSRGLVSESLPYKCEFTYSAKASS